MSARIRRSPALENPRSFGLEGVIMKLTVACLKPCHEPPTCHLKHLTIICDCRMKRLYTPLIDRQMRSFGGRSGGGAKRWRQRNGLRPGPNL